MNYRKTIALVSKTLKKHGPLILSILGSVGVVGTAYLSGKAAIKLHETEIPEDISKTEVIKKVAPIVAPAVGVGVVTIGCIMGSAALNEKAKASLVGLYLASAERFRAYREEVQEKIGKEEEKTIFHEFTDKEAKKLEINTPNEEDLDEHAHGYQNIEFVIEDMCGNEMYFAVNADTLDVEAALGEMKDILADTGRAMLWDDLLDPLGVEVSGNDLSHCGWTPEHIYENTGVWSLHTDKQWDYNPLVGGVWTIRFKCPPRWDIDPDRNLYLGI